MTSEHLLCVSCALLYCIDMNDFCDILLRDPRAHHNLYINIMSSSHSVSLGSILLKVEIIFVRIIVWENINLRQFCTEVWSFQCISFMKNTALKQRAVAVFHIFNPLIHPVDWSILAALPIWMTSFTFLSLVFNLKPTLMGTNSSSPLLYSWGQRLQRNVLLTSICICDNEAFIFNLPSVFHKGREIYIHDLSELLWLLYKIWSFCSRYTHWNLLGDNPCWYWMNLQ
jgi:hypothetical protein